MACLPKRLASTALENRFDKILGWVETREKVQLIEGQMVVQNQKLLSEKLAKESLATDRCVEIIRELN